MPLDYSERKLHSVHIHGFTPNQIEGSPGVSTGMTIVLTAKVDEKLRGPQITLEFAFPAAEEMTVGDIQREALASAAALLQRLNRETVETLAESHAKQLRDPLVPATR